ncbi:hypothetical protein PMIN03_005374 [Paraphaeosphaeria minitans]|uniref:Uncharacterized protein n=1 Tax=Paraphaeosphaeria minitans TaxID=565426 RepID=A0A9P6GDU9_9PLEO|nr:hypothetical protein PMIN01_09049 [Paraphaeosphaeria minitans]
MAFVAHHPWAPATFSVAYALGIAVASFGLVAGTFTLLFVLRVRGRKARKSFEVKRRISAPLSARPRAEGYELEEGKGGGFANRGVQTGLWGDAPELRG